MYATTPTHPAGTHCVTQALCSQQPTTEPVSTQCRHATGYGDLSMPARNVRQAGVFDPA